MAVKSMRYLMEQPSHLLLLFVNRSVAQQPLGVRKAYTLLSYKRSPFGWATSFKRYTKTQASLSLIPIYPGQKWHNELGSTMIIESYDSQSGVFFGKYKSIVGEAERSYVLTGRRDTDGNSIGWTVNWQNEDLNARSVTTWSGQLQKSPFGGPTILTTWLLTAETKPGDNWDSTNVGKDEFFTEQPSQESIERATFRCQRSHPKTA